MFAKPVHAAGSNLSHRGVDSATGCDTIETNIIETLVSVVNFRETAKMRPPWEENK
jgi:hypothetical protein